MTVIAWDGKNIAADRLRFGENIVFDGGCKMIIHSPGGMKRAVASEGDHDIGLLLKEWVVNGEEPSLFPKESDGNTLVIVATMIEIYAYSRIPVKIKYPNARFFAWGAGNELAIGALAAGATAEQAVKIACQYSRSCGFDVDSFDLSTWDHQ